MAKKDVNQYSMYLLAIVAIVAIVGIVVMVNFGDTGVSEAATVSEDDLVGQVIFDVPTLNKQLQVKECVDNDTGLDYYTYGKAEDSDSILYDNCPVPLVLNEAICVNNEPSFVQKVCKNGCEDGVCLKDEKCTDSDGGKRYYQKGKIKVTDKYGQETSKTDYCKTVGRSSGVYLKEYYCGGDNKLKSTTIKCNKGCSKGACKK